MSNIDVVNAQVIREFRNNYITDSWEMLPPHFNKNGLIKYIGKFDRRILQQNEYYSIIFNQKMTKFKFVLDNDDKWIRVEC
jgi:hypothetical protein